MAARDDTDQEMPAWRVVVAFLALLALAGALVLVSRTRDEASPPPELAATTADNARATPPPSAPEAGSAAPALEDVLPDLTSALAAWGVFAATGELDEVDRYFWPAGPQREQLSREAAPVQAAPIGLPAYEFVLTDPALEVIADDRVDVIGTVSVSRPGVETARYSWRLELRRDSESGLWRLWTVSTVDG